MPGASTTRLVELVAEVGADERRLGAVGAGAVREVEVREPRSRAPSPTSFGGARVRSRAVAPGLVTSSTASTTSRHRAHCARWRCVGVATDHPRVAVVGLVALVARSRCRPRRRRRRRTAASVVTVGNTTSPVDGVRPVGDRRAASPARSGRRCCHDAPSSKMLRRKPAGELGAARARRDRRRDVGDRRLVDLPARAGCTRSRRRSSTTFAVDRGPSLASTSVAAVERGAQRHRELVDGEPCRPGERRRAASSAARAVVPLESRARRARGRPGAPAGTPSGYHVQRCGRLAVGGDERDRPAVDRTRLVGRRHARAGRVRRRSTGRAAAATSTPCSRIASTSRAWRSRRMRARSSGRSNGERRAHGAQRQVVGGDGVLRRGSCAGRRRRAARCASRSSSTMPGWYSGCG